MSASEAAASGPTNLAQPQSGRRASAIAIEEEKWLAVLQGFGIQGPEFKCFPTVLGTDGKAAMPGFEGYTFHFDKGNVLTLYVQQTTRHRRLILNTHDPEIIAALPNNQSFKDEQLAPSLVAALEQQLRVYQTRIEGYRRQAERCAESGSHRVTAEIDPDSSLRKNENFGLSEVEREKARIIKTFLEKIASWKEEERYISQKRKPRKQEALRNKIIEVIEDALSENRKATNNFAVGEGFLNKILYDAKVFCQNFKFNQHAAVTLADQNNFSQKVSEHLPFIWDSDKNTAGRDEDIETALFKISKIYHLASNFNEKDANFTPLPFEESSRVGRLDQAFDKIKKSLRSVADYFKEDRGGQSSVIEIICNNVVHLLPISSRAILKTPAFTKSEDKEEKFLDSKAEKKSSPTERDLFVVANLAKQDLYWWNRVVIQLKILKDKIPVAFRYMLMSIKFWWRAVWRNFNAEISAGHIEDLPLITDLSLKDEIDAKNNHRLEVTLREKIPGLLKDNETLEEFIKRIRDENYQPVKADTHRKKIQYNNPVSLGLNVVKTFGNFFRHHSEKNPIMGTIAMAAYAYGATAIMIPVELATLLSKMHLGFLIGGIEFSQVMASPLASGTKGMGLAAGFTYWKMAAFIFDADAIGIESIEQLQEDPVSLAFVLGVAIGLGYATSEMLPVLKEELGTFPPYGWLVLGLKVGAGLADAVYHPSSNIISRVCEWTFRLPILAIRTVIDPIVETWRFDKNNWILNAARSFLGKLSTLLKYLFKQYPAARVFTFLLGIIGAVFIFAVAAMGFLLPHGLTHSAFTEELLANNTLFQFGKTLFVKEGYNFLPKFFKYDCYNDYFVLHPARVLGRLLTFLLNFLLLLFYILAPVLKIIAFVTSFILPSYFTSEAFKKSMQRLLLKLAEGLDAVFNIILTALKILFDELPGFLHIIYRGFAKVIAKTLGTLGGPGMLANLLFRFSKRRYNRHFSLYDEEENKLGLRFNPNYGIDRKAWKYIDTRPWPLPLCLLFALVFCPLLLIKECIKNLLLLVTDLISLGLRFLTFLLDWASRGLAFILCGVLTLLDIIMNPDCYLDFKYPLDAPRPTLGYFFKELGKDVIDFTDAIDRFFGKIKRSFLSAINRAEIASQELLCPGLNNNSPSDKQAKEERDLARHDLQNSRLAEALMETGGNPQFERVLRAATERKDAGLGEFSLA